MLTCPTSRLALGGRGGHQGTWGNYKVGAHGGFWSGGYYYADTLFALQTFVDQQQDLDKVFDSLDLLAPAELPDLESCCNPS